MAKEESSVQEIVFPPDAAHRIVSMETLRYTVDQLKEHVATEMEGQIAAIQARLGAIDRATDKFEANLVRVPTETDKAVGQLRAVMEEKFRVVETRMAGMEGLQEQQAASAKEAISAALRAAAEATAKSEVAQLKAIEQLGALIQTMSQGTEGKIADIKDRLTRIEGAAVGQMSAKTETHQGNAFVISLVGVGLAVLAGLMTIFNFIRTLPLPR